MTLSFHSINKCANLEFAQQRDKMPELSWDYHTKSFHPVFLKKRNKQNHVIFAVLCTSLNRMYQEIFKIDSWLLTFLLISFFFIVWLVRIRKMKLFDILHCFPRRWYGFHLNSWYLFFHRSTVVHANHTNCFRCAAFTTCSRRRIYNVVALFFGWSCWYCESCMCRIGVEREIYLNLLLCFFSPNPMFSDTIYILKCFDHERKIWKIMHPIYWLYHLTMIANVIFFRLQSHRGRIFRLLLVHVWFRYINPNSERLMC